MKKRCRIFYARGFTMIELLVSITLLAFAMGLTFYNFSFLHSSIVRSEIETLHATCMYLQRKAMAINQEQQISFNISNNSYSFGGTVHHLPKQVQFGSLPDAPGPPSTPRNRISSAVTFQKQRILFHPDGIMQPGTVYLVDARRASMYALSCAVSQVSYLRKYRYAGKWQRI